MTEARKLETANVTRHYSEFADRLAAREKEIIDFTHTARANLDEQVMTAPGDAADESVIDTSADYFLKLAHTHQLELIEIRDAYERMHRGVYGLCEDCESPISIERLRHLPYARTCINCQSERERSRPLQRRPTL